MIGTGYPWPLAALPRVALAGRFPLDERDFAHAYRAANHALHVYSYAGAVRFADGPVQLIRPGDWSFSPAGCATRYHLPTAGHHWCIHFAPVAASGVICQVPLHATLGPLAPRLVEQIARISGLLASPAAQIALASAAASAALQELLLTVAGHALAPVTDERLVRSHEAVARAAAHLDAHLATPLSVPGLAKRVGLSPNWFSRAFHRRFGVTAQRYLLGRRIEHAQALLRTTDMPIGRIAERLGFLDSQHFNKQFRRVAGCTPSAFRLRADGR